ncbi:MAG: ABC transporter permease, partial [Phycisphaerales bacterium]|nr:ABC transporter permease [Phycisphaerales bacterium]
MFEQALAIIRNTFLESIRQPVLLILMIIAILALVASNALSGYTMEDDNRMMVDLGLSSVFLLGTLGAAFIATSVLTREIENKTALTVISKPVGRPLFVIGKFLGVGAALTIATLFMGFVFMLVNLHGVQQTVRIPYHQPVLTFGLSALALGLFVGVWSNYFYNKVFASTVLCVTTPLLAIAYGLSLMFDAGWGAQSPAVAFRGDLWLAILGLLTAILVLTAIAIAASTRLGQVMTLSVTVGVFLIGMLSDAMFGAPAHRIEQTWLDRAHETGKAHFVTI